MTLRVLCVFVVILSLLSRLHVAECLNHQFETCAPVGRFESEIAAMEPGKIARDSQTHTGAGDPVGEFVAHAVERFENPGPFARRYAGPVVGHCNGDCITVLSAPDFDSVPGSRVLFDVAEQVANNLLDGVMIEFRLPQSAAGKLDFDPASAQSGFKTVQHGVKHIINHTPRSVQFERAPLFPAEREHVADQPAQPLAFRHDNIQMFLLFLFRLAHLVFENLGVHPDAASTPSPESTLNSAPRP